jgi:hypothetical protein
MDYNLLNVFSSSRVIYTVRSRIYIKIGCWVTTELIRINSGIVLLLRRVVLLLRRVVLLLRGVVLLLRWGVVTLLIGGLRVIGVLVV